MVSFLFLSLILTQNIKESTVGDFVLTDAHYKLISDSSPIKTVDKFKFVTALKEAVSAAKSASSNAESLVLQETAISVLNELKTKASSVDTALSKHGILYKSAIALMKGYSREIDEHLNACRENIEAIRATEVTAKQDVLEKALKIFKKRTKVVELLFKEREEALKTAKGNGPRIQEIKEEYEEKYKKPCIEVDKSHEYCMGLTRDIKRLDKKAGTESKNLVKTMVQRAQKAGWTADFIG